MTQTKRNEIARTILATVGVTGIVITGAFCPGLLALARPLARKRYPYPSFHRALRAVDDKGWIVATKTSGGVRVRLTKRGEAELLAYELGKKKLPPAKQWDGKWHLLTFDIPESRRRLRDHIRGTLKTLGFQHLQHSVWIFPYECRDVLNLLQTKYSVRHEALYVRVDCLDNDRWLRKHFGLPVAKK